MTSSRGYSLDIEYDVDDPVNVSGLANITKIMNRISRLAIVVIRPKGRNGVGIKYELATIQVHLEDILKSKMPRITSLSIAWCFTKIRLTLCPDVFRSCTLRFLLLRNIHLEGYEHTMDAQVDHPDDTRLTLSSIGGHTAQFLECLTSLPSMEALVLDNATPRFDRGLVSDTGEYVLPSLKTLYARDRLTTLQGLMSNLTTPRLRICYAWATLSDLDSVIETHRATTTIMNTPFPLLNADTPNSLVHLSFSLDDCVIFEIVRLRDSEPPQCERDDARPPSLVEVFKQSSDINNNLIANGGSRFRLQGVSTDTDRITEPNPNIIQFETSMRPGVIRATSSTQVKALHIRGLTHAIGEYVIGTNAARIAVDGKGEIVAPWVWMVGPRECIRFYDCILTAEARKSIESYAEETATTVALSQCLEV